MKSSVLLKCYFRSDDMNTMHSSEVSNYSKEQTIKQMYLSRHRLILYTKNKSIESIEQHTSSQLPGIRNIFLLLLLFHLSTFAVFDTLSQQHTLCWIVETVARFFYCWYRQSGRDGGGGAGGVETERDKLYYFVRAVRKLFIRHIDARASSRHKYTCVRAVVYAHARVQL